MSCCPNDLLALAQTLGDVEGCSEAQLRCATSRGYYSALHALIETIPPVPGVERYRDEGSHAFIIRCAQRYSQGANPGRLDAAKIVLAMKRLKDQRCKADYELDLDYELREKDDALKRVNAVFNYCDSLRAAIAVQRAQASR
ncbi:MAG: hypothetical protein KA751_01190 [Comamonas sp.]|nr:hypothetical protein [Comamonas sp.]